MFADMQRLRKSIERFEEVDGGVHNEEYTEADYAAIEREDEYFAVNYNKIVAENVESALDRMAEIQEMLDNGEFSCQDDYVALEEEYYSLERYVNSKGGVLLL